MSTTFKVIISGAGPAGLTAAHSLYLAGIDFVVLEQRSDIVLDQGASLALSPPSLRVMQQFGILDKLLDIGAEWTHQTAFGADGHQIGESTNLQYMHANHGIAPVIFHRAQLIEAIYQGLPDAAKMRVHTSKKIADVSSDNDSVRVTCTDGSVYEGSVLIGADGVHSRTRRQMRKLALAAQPNADWDDETPFSAEYKCVWSSFPLPTESGNGSEMHAKDHSMIYLAGKTRGWLFFYEKLPNRTKDHISYTKEDAVQFAQKFANYKISADLRAKDVFNPETAGMSTLEEGILKHWSWGRIALVGDACHKYTPNGGLGFNNGIQDVVALCNRLHAAVEGAEDRNPSLTDLTKTFHEYEVQRHPLAQAGLSQSATLTRLQADANLLYQFFSHHIMWLGWFQYFTSNVLGARSFRSGLVLDYVNAQEPFHGLVDWTHPLSTAVFASNTV